MTPTEERNVRLRETFGSAEKKKIENDGEHQKIYSYSILSVKVFDNI